MIKENAQKIAYSILVLFIAASFALTVSADRRDSLRSCHDNQHSWEAIDRVVAAATNPPVHAGQPLTAQEMTALAGYRQSLEEANGPRPVC